VGHGPPSSGGIAAIQQILGMLETKDMAGMGEGAEAVHYFAEAGRLAFADRAFYLGDSDYVAVPVAGLTIEDQFGARLMTGGRLSPEQ
jgi:gamma-glutamyltranspeptidase / glutathione hydrolase